MTARLYYTDSYVQQFDAAVERVEILDGRQIVRLDRTAFYPTSGGQPHDTGTLDGARVLDAIDSGDGDVLHVVDGRIVEGMRVRGRIDWARRFDHMQQHTGQHVLSAAFDRVNARTESFHLSSDSATIDVSRGLSSEEIARAEDEANGVVWENRPVTISFVDAADAAKLPLRKPPAREGRLRLIDIQDHDLSACGGTHVARTGAIGMIAVTGWERFRGGTRIGFACGERALRVQRKLRDVVGCSARLLSVLPEELAPAIERLQAEVKEQKRSIKELLVKLARHEADRLADAAADRRVIAALEGWDQHGLKLIAMAIAERPGCAALLLTAAPPHAIVIARNDALRLDAAAVLARVVDRFGGKGGGRPELAQGGGLQGDPEAIVGYLRELL